MNERTAWICCLLAGTVIFHCQGIQWLGVYRHDKPENKQQSSNYYGGKIIIPFTDEECNRARLEYGFRNAQYKFCKNENLRHAMNAILSAAKATIFHCGKYFHARRWNCSSAIFLPKMSRDLQRGTREQAFLYAFASASMVYSIARGCADSSIHNCYCDRIVDRDIRQNKTIEKWSGCHDNFKMAEQYVINFLGLKRGRRKRKRKRKRGRNRERDFNFDGPYSTRQLRNQNSRGKRSLLRLMNKHNYVAGIKIMDTQRKLFCKCHGVSGSCSVRTCSLRMTRIDDQKLMEFIKTNYLKAVKVKKVHNKLVPEGTYRGNKILPTDLVYIQHSPDYCLPDKEVGSLGTKGRQCHPTKQGSFNCENMCCGRRYIIQKRTFTDKRCNCRFSSETFNVICHSCRKTVTNYVCN